MRIEYLKEFVTLVDAMSFTEAAKRLFITQSALSKHIAAIEAELEAPLFGRDAAGLHLTDVGLSFYSDAQALLNVYANALDRVSALKDKKTSVLKVGYLRDAAQRYLGPISAWYAKNHPEVEIQFTSIDYRNMARSLKSYEIDVALTMDADEGLKRLCGNMPLCDDSLVVALPPKHPLAKKDEVSLSDLEGSRLLIPDHAIWPWIHSFLKNRISPEQYRGARTVSDVDTLFYYVESGQGAAVVASHNERSYGERVAFRPLSEPDLPHFPVSAMWLKETERHVNASKGLKWLDQAIAFARKSVG